jgi:vacuolar-type H+-ATPase subunit H
MEERSINGSEDYSIERATERTNGLDAAGEATLQLIHKAAGAADENRREAVEMAQRLSNELVSARERIGQLEAEAATYRERAERAEQWLRRVYSEINDIFFRRSENRQNGRHRSDLNGRSSQ